MTSKDNQCRELEDITLAAMMSSRTKLSDREFLFVCPMISQAAAANRSIDILVKSKETACLGLICRQLFEILVSLEYVFYNSDMKADQFRNFCKYFINNGRIGRYDKKEKKWINASIDSLCDKYIKYSKNQNVKECYNALCQMTHFSLMHTKESLCREGNTLTVDLSGRREDASEICQLADTARGELTRLIIEAIRREYLD